MLICGSTTQGSIKTNKHNLGDIYTLGFVCQLLARVQVSGVWSSACGALRSELVRKQGLVEVSYGFGMQPGMRPRDARLLPFLHNYHEVCSFEPTCPPSSLS